MNQIEEKEKDHMFVRKKSVLRKRGKYSKEKEHMPKKRKVTYNSDLFIKICFETTISRPVLTSSRYTFKPELFDPSGVF